MKLSLVVAQGVHVGKIIPIPVAQFVIGRDEACQLRPSSPAVSKKHCGLFIKGQQAFAKDLGSTNGTFINGKQITGEIEIKDGDHLKVGPLEFTLKLDTSATPSPAIKMDPKAAGAKAPERQKTPEPPPEPDHEQMAALLLATDDGPPGPLTEASIPEGTTAFEIPAAGDPNDPEKKPAPKTPEQLASTSDAASEILRKYMRRPRT